MQNIVVTIPLQVQAPRWFAMFALAAVPGSIGTNGMVEIRMKGFRLQMQGGLARVTMRRERGKVDARAERPLCLVCLL